MATHKSSTLSIPDEDMKRQGRNGDRVSDRMSPCLHSYINIHNRIRVAAADAIGDVKPGLADSEPP